ncbi:P-loop containing nucleoside triphosphate hydrolase protein, partial [Dichomitus squalens]
RDRPEEREIIEHPTSCYVIGRSGTGKTLTMMYKIVAIEHGWASSYTWGLTKPRQLFVTRSRMLAGQVHRTVNEVLESFRLAEMTQAELAELRTRRDQPEELRRPVPKKWSQLDDDHFPLFLSFDQVIHRRFEKCTISEGFWNMRFDEGSFVSGKRFISTYWSRFPQRLTHGLDPSSVFGEIMGVLQGSEEAHNTARGYLSREAYLGLSERAYSTFATERERIYNIFEAYLKLKRRRQEYDDAERSRTQLNITRTHNLLVLMVKEKLPGPPVQFLYNDEVQDNLMIDMLFMRSLSNNSNGIFWAGDTAQTITLGSSFKFSELTSLMYRVERREPNRLHIPPHTFNLTVNRRSHMGIINAAQTVVDLLTTLWSESTDKLSRDKGHKRGPKPIFIRGSTELFKLLGHRENLGVSLELGSEQCASCTIVRDEVSLDALFSRGVLGGVTLTVEQSKGLEFNDVFLWNFFGSSESSMREWAVYRNVCREAGIFHTFLGLVVEIIRSQLKCLYVAITRARNHLFIIEETVISHPMLNLWHSKDQLDIASNLESWILPVSKSLPEDWAKRGRILMDKQNYEQAKYCFQRAGLPRETNIAQAYHLRESAVTAEQFVEAAQLFESCAAKTLDVADRKELLLASATCFSRARDNLRSAELYHAALEYTKCIVQYCKATSWQKALDVICQHRDDVELRAMQNVLLHFFDLGQYSRIAEVFADTEELILFMKIHGMKPHLAAYLELLGRYQEAAEIHLGLSHIPQAIALFFRDPDPNSAAQGTTRLLDELWQVSTLGQSVNEVSKTSNVPIQTLVNLAKQRQALFGIQYKNHQIHEDEVTCQLNVHELV